MSIELSRQIADALAKLAAQEKLIAELRARIEVLEKRKTLTLPK